MKKNPNVTIRKLQRDGTMKVVQRVRARVVPITDAQRDREKAEKLCEAIRYEDATYDLTMETGVKYILLAIRYGRRQGRKKLSRKLEKLKNARWEDIEDLINCTMHGSSFNGLRWLPVTEEEFQERWSQETEDAVYGAHFSRDVLLKHVRPRKVTTGDVPHLPKTSYHSNP